MREERALAAMLKPLHKPGCGGPEAPPKKVNDSHKASRASALLCPPAWFLP
jgi:hypothetical protein